MNNVNQSNRLLPGYSENSSFGGNDANSINKQYLAQQKQQLQPLAYTPSTTHPYSTNQILQPLTQFLLPTSHNTSPYSNATNQGHQLMSSNLVEDLHGGMAFHDNSLKNARKRAFSKRSKTGCLTCRARRIKCDEAKPQCSHCLKSKRMCEYPTEEAINKKRNRRKKDKLPKSTTVPASVASANNNSANKSPILLSDIKQNSVLLPPIKNYIPQYPIKSLSISQATSSQVQPQPPHNIHSLQESSAFSKSPNPNYHTFQIPSDNLFTYPSYSASSPNNNLQSNVNYFTPPNSNSHSVSSHSTMNASSGIGSTVTNGNPDQSFFNSQMYYMNSNASPRSPSPSQHQSSQKKKYHLTTVQPQNKQQKSHQQYYSTATQMPQVLSYIPSKKFDI